MPLRRTRRESKERSPTSHPARLHWNEWRQAVNRDVEQLEGSESPELPVLYYGMGMGKEWENSENSRGFATRLMLPMQQLKRGALMASAAYP
jgi:hypothetical protein